MRYFKETEGFGIPMDFEAVYFHTPYTIAKPNIVCDLVKIKRAINNNDIAILDFIYRMKFCTEKQIERYCGKNNLHFSKERLDYLFNSRIVNTCGFVLSEDRPEFNMCLPSDALITYFLDDAGRIILEKYGKLLFVEWGVDYALEGAYTIGRYLTACDFYINVITTTGMEVTEFEFSPVFSIKKDSLVALSHYRFLVGNKNYYFIMEVFRDTDEKLSVRKKIRYYESLLATQFWRKYYPDTDTTPMLIIQVDNDNQALTLAKEIADCTKMVGFRLTTDDRLYKGLGSEGAFLSYDKETETLNEVAVKFFS